MTAPPDRNIVGHLLAGAGVDAWGVARNEPRLPLSPDLPTAVSIMMRLVPAVVRDIAKGPTQAYESEYRRLNEALDQATTVLAEYLAENGARAERIPATVARVRDGELVFAHKTAATQAGLGWIGKTGLFVSRQFGPAVRLATVFTDLPLTPGRPITTGRCGTCDLCLRACSGSRRARRHLGGGHATGRDRGRDRLPPADGPQPRSGPARHLRHLYRGLPTFVLAIAPA